MVTDFKAIKQQLTAFFHQEFPQADFLIEEITGEHITIRKKITEQHLRPGRTVSGPVLMEVADAALYVAILAKLGLVAQAVTTNLNINFLSRPSPDNDIIAKCQLIKVGKTLAMGDVFIYSEYKASPVAHATGTYALPASSTSQ